MADGADVPWSADLLVDDLAGAWRLLHALPAAAAASRRGVELSTAASLLGALLMVPGVRAWARPGDSGGRGGVVDWVFIGAQGDPCPGADTGRDPRMARDVGRRGPAVLAGQRPARPTAAEAHHDVGRWPHGVVDAPGGGRIHHHAAR